LESELKSPTKNLNIKSSITFPNEKRSAFSGRFAKLPIKLSSRFSVRKAHEMQLQMAEQVIREDHFPKKIRYVAGVDIAYAGETSIGAVAVLDFDSLSLVESKTACFKTRFPYVSTLLSFREIAPALLAMKKLTTAPEVFMVDGQGTAHPYRLGFASHLGLVVNNVTIGVAKSLLSGKVKTFQDGKKWTPIMDKEEIIGAAVITNLGRKPVYVSIGHRVSLERAINLVLHCAKGHRIPEPLRKAHTLANEEKTRLCL
jgi:deoxyribonuclease V